jgi:hypothetical protein
MMADMMLLHCPAPLRHEGLGRHTPGPFLRNRTNHILSNGILRKHNSKRTQQQLWRSRVGSNVVCASAGSEDWKAKSQSQNDKMVRAQWVGEGTIYEPRVLDLSPTNVQSEVNVHLATTKEPHFTAPIGIHRHKPLFVYLPGLDGTVRAHPS